MVPYGSVLYVLAAVAEPDLPGEVAHAVQHGVRVVTLLYDASAFLRGKHGPAIASAVNADYIGRLRSAGAMPIVVPIDVAGGP